MYSVTATLRSKYSSGLFFFIIYFFLLNQLLFPTSPEKNITFPNYSKRKKLHFHVLHKK
jgi:hypothetical protein